MNIQSALDAVFKDFEVSERFLSFLRKYGCLTDEEAWKWLRTPPRNTIVRVNTLKTTTKEALMEILEHLRGKGDTHTLVTAHDILEEVIVIHGTGEKQVSPEVKIVIVGEMCGLAVLRGADVFSPGIVSAPVDLSPGDRVAVMADVTGACLRGAKQFQGELCFVGNGVSKVSRDDLFKTEGAKGVGIEMFERIFDCPSLDDTLFSGSIMLQNLPSIMAVDLLDPQPGETVLDMCSAPGGKTTHLAQRMNNRGLVVAFDKSRNKVEVVKKNCERLGVDIVKAFVMDGTKSCEERACSEGSPPYPPEYFDRILVDAPCSGLGQRPQFYNKMKLKELNSFPKIQKKLFATAVKLLKVGGTLVYSTCTNNTDENENIVEWAKESFECLDQVDLEDTMGSGCLNFGHPSFELDTISFFISKFTKRDSFIE